MAEFLSEGFEGGTDGATLTGAETIFQAPVGTGTAPTFTTDAIEGSLALRVAPAGGHTSARVDFTTRATVWLAFYLKPVTEPSTNTATINGYLGGTKVFDVRGHPDGAWQMRSVNNDRYTSPALAMSQYHRVAVLMAPTSGGTGTCRMRIYSGASLHALTPTHDSGAQGLAALAAGMDNLRFGSISADSTLVYIMDRLRVDDATEPGPIAGNTGPTANAGVDQTGVEPYAEVILTGADSTDPDGTITTWTWTQTVGPPVALTGDPSSPFRTLTAPATMDGTTLTFALTVTDDAGVTSTADTVNITVLPHNLWRKMGDGTLAPIRRSRVMAESAAAGFGAQPFGTSPFGGT